MMTPHLRSACDDAWRQARRALHDSSPTVARAQLLRLHALGAHLTLWHMRCHAGLCAVAVSQRRYGPALREAMLVILGALTAVIAPFLTELDAAKPRPADVRRALAGQPRPSRRLPQPLRRVVLWARQRATDAADSP